MRGPAAGCRCSGDFRYRPIAADRPAGGQRPNLARSGRDSSRSSGVKPDAESRLQRRGSWIGRLKWSPYHHLRTIKDIIIHRCQIPGLTDLLRIVMDASAAQPLEIRSRGLRG